jgi:hypothetical protein
MSGQQLQVMNAIRDASAPFLRGGSEKSILYALATFAGADGWSWPSLERLGLAAGLSKRSTYPVVEKLLNAGVLDVVKGSQRTPNRYRINLDALLALTFRREEASPLSDPSGEATSPLAQACGEEASPLVSTRGEEASPLTTLRREAPSPLAPPEGKILHARGEATSPEGVQEGKEERERPRPSEIRVIGAEPGTRTAIPDDLPLTGDAKAFAETIGVRDIDDEWTKFVAHHVKTGDLADTRGWYQGAWRKWCVNAKRFQSAERTRDAQRQQRADADAERPYHVEAKLPKREKPLTPEQRAAVEAQVAALFSPKKAVAS